MTLLPMQAQPGICKAESDYAAGKTAGGMAGRMVQGRYTDGNRVRFDALFPEKIGGWQAISAITGIIGAPRVQRSWRDNAGLARLCIGTETHLYSWDGTTLVDITPLQTISTGTLGANPFTTTASSTTVAVADAAQTLVNGDWVSFSGATTFNGVTINGWYQVSARSGAGYNITLPAAATGSGAGGGAAVLFGYPRVTLGANPFATTSGSAVVTVTHAAHGQTTGNYVTFNGATAVAGLTLNSQYQLTVVNANSYTITALSNANATTTGGGAAVQVTYNLLTINQALNNAVAYGAGAYGVGPYGYSQSTTSTPVASWTLSAYGNQMLAAPIGGTIYVFNPVFGGHAYPLLNAPSNVSAMFVTPERFVVALVTSAGALIVKWADQTDYTVWTSLPTNTAQTGRSLIGGTAWVTGFPVRDGVSLSLSDKAAFFFNYSGDNFVYHTPEATDTTSCVGPAAYATFGNNAYWMGTSDFWVWDGSVHTLPSDDIRAYVYRNINPLYISKCWACSIRNKQEIWFNYPSAGSTEIDRYVIYHINQQCWSIGTWSGLSGSGLRTAGVDAFLFSTPIFADVNGVIYQHETGTDDNGQAMDANITYSPVDISNGDQNMDIFGFIPDFTRLTGSCTVTIDVRRFPQDPNSVTLPFTITDNDTTPNVDLRLDGKMAGYLLDSNVLGGDFRFGTPRLNVQPGGARL
jgi:hypothetical protein